MQLRAEGIHAKKRQGIAGLFLAGLVGLGAPSAAPGMALPSKEPVVVAFVELDETKAADEEQKTVSRIVEDLLLQRLQEQYTKVTGRQIEFRLVKERPPEDNSARNELARQLGSAGVHYYLAPELSFLTSGYALRVLPVSLAGAAGPDWVWRGQLATMIISGRVPDLAQIEKEIVALAGRIVEIMERGPEQSIFCWCIQPIDRTNRDLVFIARRLTLELWYYLSVRDKLNKYKVSGLSAPEYVSECQAWEGGRVFHPVEQVFLGSEQSTAEQATRRPEQYTYVISGEVGLSSDGKVEVGLRVDSRELGGSIPLGSFSFREKKVQELPGRLAKDVEQAWEKMVAPP